MQNHIRKSSILQSRSPAAFSPITSSCGENKAAGLNLLGAGCAVPVPIPLDELQRAYDWLKSWSMLEETASPLHLINMQVQAHAHEATE
jgi:hypothetical protein